MHRVVVSIDGDPTAAAVEMPPPAGVQVVVGVTKPAHQIVVTAAPQGQGQLPRAIRMDASRPIAYAGYPARILRLDYSTWPPAITSAATIDLNTDWPNRAGLEYA